MGANACRCWEIGPGQALDFFKWFAIITSKGVKLAKAWLVESFVSPTGGRNISLKMMLEGESCHLNIQYRYGSRRKSMKNVAPGASKA